MESETRRAAPVTRALDAWVSSKLVWEARPTEGVAAAMETELSLTGGGQRPPLQQLREEPDGGPHH